ncbi:hypothetical protein P153DRAFT_386934 [Dothidotthia symphoricarpi CBS 119687]|uniref:Uncharacterized protein n=1 Tax=Dothidotthia symphoricarpi CBS 119687 TaxID=1392245 RepID=A0A6A6AAS5_9PLEO|nr:uncharacterized protein P153DRAFT_386934 [Dothidotthia symphoricarpi CBS 119687]KAF2127957.1 hypothetical protein P153DRAFT_386934 [Dothidotthia symphoricarpi CBS 119687]
MAVAVVEHWSLLATSGQGRDGTTASTRAAAAAAVARKVSRQSRGGWRNWQERPKGTHGAAREFYNGGIAVCQLDGTSRKMLDYCPLPFATESATVVYSRLAPCGCARTSTLASTPNLDLGTDGCAALSAQWRRVVDSRALLSRGSDSVACSAPLASSKTTPQARRHSTALGQGLQSQDGTCAADSRLRLIAATLEHATAQRLWAPNMRRQTPCRLLARRSTEAHPPSPVLQTRHSLRLTASDHRADDSLPTEHKKATLHLLPPVALAKLAKNYRRLDIVMCRCVVVLTPALSILSTATGATLEAIYGWRTNEA